MYFLFYSLLLHLFMERDGERNNFSPKKKSGVKKRGRIKFLFIL